MGIPKLSELMTPPVISKFYLMPCIQVLPNISAKFRYGSWLPILAETAEAPRSIRFG